MLRHPNTQPQNNAMAAAGAGAGAVRPRLLQQAPVIYAAPADENKTFKDGLIKEFLDRNLLVQADREKLRERLKGFSEEQLLQLLKGPGAKHSIPISAAPAVAVFNNAVSQKATNNTQEYRHYNPAEGAACAPAAAGVKPRVKADQVRPFIEAARPCNDLGQDYYFPPKDMRNSNVYAVPQGGVAAVAAEAPALAAAAAGHSSSYTVKAPGGPG